jgi:DNA polymerase I
LLSLTGDSADNIDGVPGVGKKTASDLLKEFGTIEGIFENFGRIKSDRIRGLLSGKRDLLERNRKIIKLIMYSDCSFASEKFKITTVDGNRLIDFFRKYGMNSRARDMAEPELF